MAVFLRAASRHALVAAGRCIGTPAIVQPRGLTAFPVAARSFRTCSVFQFSQAEDLAAAAKADVKDGSSPVSPKVAELVEEIAKLNLVEAAELSTALSEKLGLGDIAINMGGGGGAAAASGEEEEVAVKEEEKTIFDVRLDKFEPSKKIAVIKELRAMINVGAKEAKGMVEGELPLTVLKGMQKEEAEAAKAKLEAAGATIVLA